MQLPYNKKQRVFRFSLYSSAYLFSLLVATLFTTSVSAELKPMGTYALSQVTGKAGLTIDIETELTIAEIEYQDAGSMFWRDISLGGIGGGRVDNIRARVDFTDGTETLLSGFADIAWLADLGYLDATEADVAWAIAEYSDGFGNFGKQYGDGDALIHVTSTDYGIDILNPPNPADHAANLDAYKHAVDLHYQEGAFGLRASDDSRETLLTENFSVQAYLGYLDILLTNNGNGFTQTTSGDGRPDNVRLGDSYIGIDAKFRVDDLDVDRSNNATNTFIPREATQPGLTLRDFRIHNERGIDTLGSFGFASFESKLGSVMDSVLHVIESGGATTHVDGHAIYDINVRMDWDLPHISFGDTGQSIGEVYLTDFIIEDTSLVISAH